jgi:hypothetical protein
MKIRIWTEKILHGIDAVLERSEYYHAGKRSRHPFAGTVCASVAVHIISFYGMLAAFGIRSIALNFGASAPLSDSSAACALLFAMCIEVLIFQYTIGCCAALLIEYKEEKAK